MSLDYSVAWLMARLRDWAPLPKYQLERRIDIFITPFLEALVGSALGGTASLVVPEFPLRTLRRPPSASELRLAPSTPGEAPEKKETAHTVNADYLFWVQPPGGPPFWVILELKTDPRSFDDDQASLYLETRELGMKVLRKDIKDVMEASGKYAPKYAHLRAWLAPYDEGVSKLLVVYLGPSALKEPAEAWTDLKGRKIDKYISLNDLSNLDPNLIPAEHRELWPYVRDLLRALDPPCTGDRSTEGTT